MHYLPRSQLNMIDLIVHHVKYNVLGLQGIVREEKVLPEHQPYHLQHHLWTENFTIEVILTSNGSNLLSNTWTDI